MTILRTAPENAPRGRTADLAEGHDTTAVVTSAREMMGVAFLTRCFGFNRSRSSAAGLDSGGLGRPHRGPIRLRARQHLTSLFASSL